MNLIVAEKLDLLEQWEEWDGEWYDSNFCCELGEKYGVTPTAVIEFRERKGSEISGLTGFANDTTYVLFDEDESGEAWDKLVALLEEKGIELDRGSWSQLG
jgi:hypothetical protein